MASKVLSIISRIREDINDTQKSRYATNKSIIDKINDEIFLLSKERISARDNSMVVEKTINNNSLVAALDKKFYKFAGKHPVRIVDDGSGRKFEILDGRASLKIRYFSLKDPIEFIDETTFNSDAMPFDEEDDAIIVQKVAMKIGLLNEAEIGQDKAILDEERQIATAAKQVE